MLTYNIIEKFPKNIEKYHYNIIFPGPYRIRSATGCVQISLNWQKSIATSCFSY